MGGSGSEADWRQEAETGSGGDAGEGRERKREREREREKGGVVRVKGSNWMKGGEESRL